MKIILVSAVAGIAGTGIGGLAAAFMDKKSSDMMCWILSFAGGVMMGIVCFELVPEAFGFAGMGLLIAGLAAGVVTIMALNRLVEKMGAAGGAERRENPENPALLRSGILMLVAIAIHNVPEGLAIGAAGSHDFQLGATLAAMITLHDIPEGMAIAVMLAGGGLSKGRAVALTALSGATTLLGGILGTLVGGISDAALCLSLAAAGGAMLYVVFNDILPQTVTMSKSRFISLVTLAGIVVGLMVTEL